MKVSFTKAGNTITLITETPNDQFLLGKLTKNIPHGHVHSASEPNQKEAEFDLAEFIAAAAR